MRDPSHISRRSVLAGLAASGALAVSPSNGFALDSKNESEPPILSQEARGRSSDALLHYFAESAPKLLRDPAGILKHPSVAPSLPGKTYSTNLWDWDTLWTSKGLFRLAALLRDDQLRQKLCEHVAGSLLNFLEHASPGGQIPIMMTPDDPAPLRTPGKNSTSRNQGKPVFGQLALLACDQRGDAKWLKPHFDSILRFYDSWIKHNSSSIGLLVWGDDVAIGDDNDPTTFGRPFISSAN
jgi:putative isomerase